MRVKERRTSNWQRQLTPTPKPEARPEARQPGAAWLVPVKPEQLFGLCPGAAWDWAKKMGRSAWLQPGRTRTIYIHIRFSCSPNLALSRAL